MLHAKQLIFQHPITQEKITLTAPLPEYFEKILGQLENVL